MPEKINEADYLRDKARRLRDIADIQKNEISERLLHLAREMEARADALEGGNRTASSAG